MTSTFAKVILSAEGELKDFVLSKSSVFQHRIIGEKEAEKKLKIKAQEVASEHPYCILHFDGKKVEYASGEKQESDNLSATSRVRKSRKIPRCTSTT